MHNQTDINIVLHQPEIPGNAGSIGRTCLALNAKLILIRPYGFNLDEKSVRRAGLDYWKYVQIEEYNNWKDFLFFKKPSQKELFFIETTAKESIYNAQITPRCYLIFGSETKGLPKELISEFESQTYDLPMFSNYIRSLNLSNAATAAAYIAHMKLNLNSSKV